MRQVTAIIRRDHESIRLLLGIAEAFAEGLARGEPVAIEHLREVNELLLTFVTRCHCAQEAEVLFPVLVDRGAWHRAALLAIMVEEHELGADELDAMIAALAKGDLLAWAAQARAYVELILRHARIEDDLMLTAADRVLSPDEQLELAAAFERLAEERLGAGGRDAVDRRIGALAAALKSG